jgi:hypothetical protein
VGGGGGGVTVAAEAGRDFRRARARDRPRHVRRGGEDPARGKRGRVQANRCRAVSRHGRRSPAAKAVTPIGRGPLATAARAARRPDVHACGRPASPDRPCVGQRSSSGAAAFPTYELAARTGSPGKTSECDRARARSIQPQARDVPAPQPRAALRSAVARPVGRTGGSGRRLTHPGARRRACQRRARQPRLPADRADRWRPHRARGAADPTSCRRRSSPRSSEQATPESKRSPYAAILPFLPPEADRPGHRPSAP